jgi:MFS family permease
MSGATTVTGTTTKSSILPKWLLKESLYAPVGFNRWRVPPAAVGVHLSIGSVYSWSIFNAPLTKELGVVVSSANDFTLSGVVPIFSTAIVCLGFSAAAAGHWLEIVGPRLVGLTAAACWGGGFIVGGMGVEMHSLPMIYAGYGILGGIGLGLGYVSPVSTLIRWFPDKRGMATGMAIMGFGGGAMIGAPMKEKLLQFYSSPPDYIGTVESIGGVDQLDTIDGVRYYDGVEVVLANSSDLIKSTLDMDKWGDTIGEGLYVVGTGDTGASMTFITLGALYATVMTLSSMQYKIPQENWLPEGWTPPPQLEEDEKVENVSSSSSSPSSSSSSPPPLSSSSLSQKWKATDAGVTSRHVHIDQALYTPQFWQLWLNLTLNVTAGIGVIGVAKTMMGDIFASSLPTIVTGSFAATYVMMISVANMSGRFAWASCSDYLGRKNTYSLFFAAGVPLYLSVPYAANMAASNPGLVTPLGMFYGSTMIIFTMYGGGFATVPAYLADVFGTKYVGGIHGRLLTAWSTAGIAGPLTLTYLRNKSTNEACEKLTNVIDNRVFYEHFGADKTALQTLIDTKTVTISKLMDICPAGTVDPTPALYDTTMQAMAGLLGVAFISNILMKPVHSKHWMEEEEHKK